MTFKKNGFLLFEQDLFNDTIMENEHIIYYCLIIFVFRLKQKYHSIVKIQILQYK